MADRDEIECTACGWTGLRDELVCSEEDGTSDTPPEQVMFNICPNCGEAGQCEDLDEEED